MTIFEFDEIESSNDTARAIIEDGVSAPFWVLANSQTKGRGRLKREWRSQRGNLFCSGVIDFGSEVPNPLYSFVIGLAVYETIMHFAHNAEAILKWPNDILIEGAKISGILLETHTFQRRNFLIIGIGVNLVSAPKILDRETICLAQISETFPSPKDFINVMIGKIDFFLKEFQKHSFSKIRPMWLDRAMGLGEKIIIDQGVKKISGIFRTINPNGELELETENGCVFINSGDVIFQQLP